MNILEQNRINTISNYNADTAFTGTWYNVLHYANPLTGQNDVTMVVFDLRIFQQELLQMNQPTQAFEDLLAQESLKIQHSQQNIDVEGLRPGM